MFSAFETSRMSAGVDSNCCEVFVFWKRYPTSLPMTTVIGAFIVDAEEVCADSCSMSVRSSLWDWISLSSFITGRVVVVTIDPNMMMIPITRMNPRGITDPCEDVVRVNVMYWVYVFVEGIKMLSTFVCGYD